MTKNIFQGSEETPFHISIGAVLTDGEGSICCHFYKKDELPMESEGVSDLYLLMRETLEPGQTIEETVARGLKEEFGAEGKLKAYIGSIRSWFPLHGHGIRIEKTTLYFHVEMTTFNPTTREDDVIESRSEILWKKPEVLEALFAEQGRKYERTDLDESTIIRSYITYAANHPQTSQ